VNAAIVTGAAGAIGRAVALELAREGRPVLCVDRDENVIDVCADIAELGGTGAPCLVDLADPSAPATIASAVGALGGAGMLVNNAGIIRDARATKLESSAFRAVVRVNAVAAMRLAEAIAPQLLEGGAIVNIVSRAALGNFGQPNYVAAKSALIGATRAYAMRWAPRVRVNAVGPGLIDTPMTAAMPPEILSKLIERVPAGRPGDPAEIARVVAFLGSDRASYVTGQVLFACGGRSVAG
jgi:3-oxoacyl-[acyl-carrier protein] reductase